MGLLIVGGAIAISATWAFVGSSSDPSAPVTAASVPTDQTPSTVTGSSATTNTDATVCRDFDRVGRSFYQVYYVPLMRNNGHGTADPIQLAASVGAVSTVGAPTDQIDGSSTIAQATPAIRSAMSDTVRAANSIAQGAVSSSIYGGNRIPELTPMLTSFTQASVSCTHAGYQPSWFNVRDLRSN